MIIAVKDLIEKLKSAPQDAQIVIEDSEGRIGDDIEIQFTDNSDYVIIKGE